jgi:Rps23 Pro-64 3,4-dihydroxylase Tpa1-like proline 4-hydroxylase
MTAKQILDVFSETLMQDERILSPRERDLLMNLLQNSRAISSSNPETQSAVTATIARSVGETVTHRAFALLGGSIVEQILASAGVPAGTQETWPHTAVELGLAPEPPAPPGPLPPGVRRPPDKTPTPPAPGPLPPGVRRPPDKTPTPPSPGPLPPGVRKNVQPFGLPVQQAAQQSQHDSRGSVGVLEAPAIVRAQCVVLDEFLAPQELEELVHYTLQHETDFQNSGVVSPNGDAGMIDYDHRRSQVLMDLGRHEQVILERIQAVLPRVLDQLGMEPFPVTRTEAQITASNDGDFFGMHSDDGHEITAGRRLTFVYFFHREPRQFQGGELRLHDWCEGGEPYGSAGSYQRIVPQPNQIVFFPCSVLHEITPVECLSRAFADSRFTLNGWLHN